MSALREKLHGTTCGIEIRQQPHLLDVRIQGGSEQRRIMWYNDTKDS